MELRALGHMIPFRQDLTLFIIEGEASPFGLENLEAFQRSFSSYLDELMNLIYLSYYLLLPVATIPLFCQGKIHSASAIIFLVTLTYLSNFLFFYFFPCLSPNYLISCFLGNKKQGGLWGWFSQPADRFYPDQRRSQGRCLSFLSFERSDHALFSFLVLW